MNVLVVGAGLAGCTCARLLAEQNNTIIILDKQDHIGGICYDYLSEDKSCYIHSFGPHIFHTNNKEVWNFVNKFSDFNEYVHRGISLYNDKLYSFPVNFNTIYQVFGKRVYSSKDVDILIHDIIIENPKNFEEAALNAVGSKLYKIFIKNYVIKQWKIDKKKTSNRHF